MSFFSPTQEYLRGWGEAAEGSLPKRTKVLYEHLETNEEYGSDQEKYVAVFDETHNLISSKLAHQEGVPGPLVKHSPVLDIDFPIRAVPSTTEGHFHLYLDGLVLPWWKYSLLLRALAFCGVIEKGYAGVSINAHKQTYVRSRQSKVLTRTEGIKGNRAGKVRQARSSVWLNKEAA